MTEWTRVSSPAELIAACSREHARIEVAGALSGMPMTRLAPGVQLRGGQLRFGAKGLQLTRDNSLDSLRVETAERELAIFNDLEQDTLGTLKLSDVETVGQVCLFADGAVKAGRVEVAGLQIARADIQGSSSRQLSSTSVPDRQRRQFGGAACSSPATEPAEAQSTSTCSEPGRFTRTEGSPPAPLT
jgi:hypothetical protein